MSTEDTAGKGDIVLSVCANCGKGEEESDKLKACTACKLVKYCNRECQIAHRPQHKKECKRRAAELHDEKLFKQPPPLDDCPICFIQLPTQSSGWGYYACCGKTICCGCAHSPVYDNQGNEVDNDKCPFCRTPIPSSYEEAMEREKKRVDASDAEAIFNCGNYYRDGTNGYPQDYTKALEHWHKAVKLGHSRAYTNIGASYHNGEGIEVDKKKAQYYYELSAVGGGCVVARHNQGLIEKRKINIDRALKHFKIAVRSGHSESLKKIKDFYSNGFATKDDYTNALQLYQTYLGEIKSKERDKAVAFNERYRYY